MAFKPQKIVVHHSLTRDSGSVSWGAIRKYHTETLGWSDIGYHIGVEQTGTLPGLFYEILMGRMWDRQGAHTRGYNQDTLAICFVGNFDEEPPPEAQLLSGARVIAYWLKLFGLEKIDIQTHNFYNQNKSCPGKKFDIRVLKSYIY